MIVPMTERSLVAEARRLSIDVATREGLDESDASRAAIVATELGTNLIKHAEHGEISITAFDDSDGKGVEVLALDKGPGILDLQRSLADGHSTAGSAGSGLGSVRRNADVFGINSQAGRGTAVLARIRPKGQRVTASYIVSSLSAPYPGETVCGDGWSARHTGRKLMVLLADGSGHGPLAHVAAVRAIEMFGERGSETPEQIAQSVHRALGATRGAAIAIAEIDLPRGHVNFSGIGNISAALLDRGSLRRMVSYNGTAGHSAPKIHAFQYPFQGPATVILHSDGLTARWDLDQYPGLAAAHPSLISGVLYRDYRRGRDDATVVTVRSSSAWPAS
jgi:anti-sigma regulatory factor (Ser/Thr protein kinase)